MNWIPVYLLLCTSLAAQTVAIQNASDARRGRISGLVLDERWKPVAGMTVTAWSPGPIAGRLPSTQTDEDGRFALRGLLPGHTYVNASNEEAFYPGAWSSVWDGAEMVQVEVPEAGEASGIVLLVKPAGRLAIQAKNAETGKDVDAIGVRLERDGEPERWLNASALGNRFLVPTAPIRFCVQAEGFQPAWYGGDGSFEQSSPLTVSARQTYTAIVSLHSASGTGEESSCFSDRNR